jgi:hypothetical protein
LKGFRPHHLFFVLCIALVGASPLFAAEFLSVSEIHPGMKGVFKTIISGDQPEPVDFEVLDVLPASAPGGGPLILIRAFGENAKKAGGIAQGMSGSPAYIGGKLIGAISIGFPFADPNIGGITPFEDMIKTLPSEGLKPSEWIEQGLVPGISEGASAGFPRTKLSLEEAIISSFPVFDTSLPFFAGVAPGSRTFSIVSALFQSRFPRATLLTAGIDNDAPLPYSPTVLRPGDAVAYILGHGVFPIYGFGTVTDVTPDGRFLAFGHSALNNGDVSLPAGNIYVSATVPSVESPFKMGRPTSIVGFFSSDRGPATAGLFGAEPPTLPMTITITDAASGKTYNFREEIAPMEFAFAPLAALSVIQSAERALQRTGKGTAEYSFSIIADGLTPIHWTDHATQFYTLSSPHAPVLLSSQDIVSSIAVDLYDLLSTLLGSPYARVIPRKIEFSATIWPDEKSILVDDIQFVSPVPLEGVLRIDPGTSLNVKVTVRKFRGSRETYDLTLPIPKDLAPGPYLLVAYGGSRMATTFPTQAEKEGEQAVIAYGEALRRSRKIRSAQDLVDAWFRKDKNSDLVLRLIPAEFAGERDKDNLPPPPPDVSVSRDLGSFVMGFVSQPVDIGRRGREPRPRAGRSDRSPFPIP